VTTITLCVLGWAVGWILLGAPRRVRDLRSDLAAVDPGEVGGTGYDVIIPARDEADVIGLLLSDLAPLAGTGNRVLVVDDHSSDATASVAGGFAGVEVIAAPDLPEGWTGKSWACHTGVAAISGSADPQPQLEVDSRGLVFLDADVRLGSATATGPEVLSLLVRRQRQVGGLVSVQPWHETRLLYERLSALFNVLAIMGTAMTSRRGPTGAFGPVLVTNAEDYRASGGHEAVREQVVEDLALAERYTSAGRVVDLYEGGQDVRFRMYPNGPAQLIEGWTKNFATGAVATRPLRLLGAVLWITGLGSGVVALVDGVRGGLPLWVGIGLYTAFVLQLVRMFRQVGRFGPVAALLYPGLLAFFFAVFARSVWSSRVRRRVTWRGRAIPVGVRRA